MALFGIIFALLNGADITDIRIRLRIYPGYIVCDRNGDVASLTIEIPVETVERNVKLTKGEQHDPH